MSLFIESFECSPSVCTIDKVSDATQVDMRVIYHGRLYALRGVANRAFGCQPVYTADAKGEPVPVEERNVVWHALFSEYPELISRLASKTTV